VREFNPYISVSDLLEAFIGDAGKYGVDQDNVLKLPVEAFINWLIRKAAEKDGDSVKGLPTVQQALPNPNAPVRQPPRCVMCGRFIKRALVAFCSVEHFQLRLEKLA
jgi:hypothetical protein